MQPIKGSQHAHDSLVKACCDMLTLYRIPNFRINQKPHRQRNAEYRNQGASIGAPDIIASCDGTALLIECKTGKSRIRAEQSELLSGWVRDGAIVLIIRRIDQLYNWIRGTESDSAFRLTAIENR